MFTDRVKVKLAAGRGGNGVVAWMRARFIAKGGPCGGNGGKGGSIILEVKGDLYNLDHLRHTRICQASNGGDGGASCRQGAKGKELIVPVPCGTLVKDSETGEIIRDLTTAGERWEICKGGRGGLGNDFFKSPTNRAPLKCTPGKEGETFDVELELKLIADVGFIGMPNAGKSTLLSTLTRHEVPIGNYPFTTLKPNLSFIAFDDFSRIHLADIPGIIKDAHQNRGLGLQFLRHIERSQMLIFIVDAAGSEGRDPFDDFTLLREELRQHNPTLLDKPYLVALNKCDIPDAEPLIAEFLSRAHIPSETLFPISAKNRIGLDPLIAAMRAIVQATSKNYV